ncbi:ABC transporter substrate-binding protein [Ramlibacter rhizophilus]|uniref:ABC transporter substrate-binding protein n=1 Tax=Ramlibacter rhizophilus TaxID=1781167 RepID=A0A4Z0C0G1_9BURK|nr:ABC transporter substrate-binding protein [Ramlibacter rhizophilus]TFZ04412.1 ABC transporter substrate-binding protein [Ramlibacter rhizophilus]
MTPFRSTLLSAALALALAPLAQAQSGGSDGTVRIGVVTDMTGALSDLSGRGSATAVRMAVEDFGGKVLGKPIEVLEMDHQNKPDIASSKVREWFDREGVDMVTDLTNSAVALAVMNVAKQKDRIAIVNGAGATRITNDACTPNSVHYAWDTYAMANGTARALLKKGGDSWYFLTADYAFGHQSEKDVTEVVNANGGKVLGSSRHPLGASDFSSFMLSAKNSGAKIIGLANGGADTINAIKSAQEFGVDPKKQSLAGLAVFITDIHSAGLQASQGLILTEAFYWDLDEQTRQFARRYFERMKKMPTAIQAANYSSTLHYLKAVKAAGTDAAAPVMAKMKGTKVNDFFAKNGTIREDGRMVHDMYLVQVKQPGESKHPWDYYKVLATIPGDEAFQPIAKSTCSLVKK